MCFKPNPYPLLILRATYLDLTFVLYVDFSVGV